MVALTILAGLAAAAAADRGRFWLAQAPRPDDLWRYHAARLTIPGAADANSLVLSDNTRIGLLATLPPRDPEFARLARQRLGEIVAGREVLLRIEAQCSRDSSGRLLAHVYADDRNIAIELLKQGMLRVDRNSQTPFRDTFLAAEDTARRKHLGMWMHAAVKR